MRGRNRKPTEADTPFIQFICYTIGYMNLPEDSASIMGQWQDEYLALRENYQRGGMDDFNAYLEVLRRKHPFLTNWLATPYEQEPVLPDTLLSEVTPEPITWLWKGRLAIRKLHLLDGDPGLGKTTLMFDIIARLTTGRAMPNEERPVSIGGAVILSMEDGLEDTIQPRLARAGARLDKVSSIGEVNVRTADGQIVKRPFDISEDLPLLESAIKRVEARIVFIDPIMALLGGKDTYKDSEVRAALIPLKILAERCNVAVILIRHLNKSGGDKAIYAGGGSIAFIGFARIGMMVVKNPDDDSQCVLANIKNNLSKQAPKLLYSIVSDEEQGDERPYIRWEGISTHTDQELMSKPTDVPGEGRQKILQCLKEHFPDALTPSQICDELEMGIDNVKKTLGRMVNDDQIKKEARGLYAAHSGINPTT